MKNQTLLLVALGFGAFLLLSRGGPAPIPQAVPGGADRGFELGFQLGLPSNIFGD